MQRRALLLGSLLLAVGLHPRPAIEGQEPARDLREELMLAVEMNDLVTARQVIREGGDLEINFGVPSPLTTAVQLDLVPMVALLLELGGDPAITADRPLEVAVRNGSRDMVRVLLREGDAPLPAAPEELAELFDYALRSGDLVILEELLYAGGDPTRGLASAVADGDYEAMLLTFDYGAVLSALPAGPELIAAVPPEERERFFEAASRGKTEEAAHIAAAAAADGDAEWLELAFENGVEPGFEHLRLLAENGHEALALRFLERLGAPRDELLERARESSSPRLTELLERRRRQEMRRFMIPAVVGLVTLAFGTVIWRLARRRIFISPRRLHDAVERGDLAQTSRLLRTGADPNSWRNFHQPLHKAALADDIRTARALLHHDAEIDSAAQDDLGLSPLHLAATVGSVALVELLLRHGARIDVRAADGLTPLYAAASAGHGGLVSLLLERGGDPNSPGSNGESLLLTAVSTRDATAVRHLLAAGADPNVDQGRTPLHAAAAAGDREIVGLLLERGAAKGAVDSTGRTPLDLARLHQRADVVALLEKNG